MLPNYTVLMPIISSGHRSGVRSRGKDCISILPFQLLNSMIKYSQVKSYLPCVPQLDSESIHSHGFLLRYKLK